MEGSMERRSVEGSLERRSMERSTEHGSMEEPEIQVYGSEEDERESEGDHEEDNQDNYDNGWRDYGETQAVRIDVPSKKLPGSESCFSLSDGSDIPQLHYRPERLHSYKVEWLPEDQWKAPRGRTIQSPKEDPWEMTEGIPCGTPPIEDDPWEMANTEDIPRVTPLKEDDPWEMSNTNDEDNTHEPSKSPSFSPSPSQASTEDHPDFLAPLSLDFSTAKPYRNDCDEQSINLPSDALSRLPAGLLETDDDDDMGDLGDIAPPRTPQVFSADQRDIPGSSLLDLDTEIEIMSPVQATNSRSMSSASLLDMCCEDEAKPTTPPLLELLKEPTEEPRGRQSTPPMITLLDQESPPVSLLDQSTRAISLNQESLVQGTSFQGSLIPVASLIDQGPTEMVPVKPSIPLLLDDLASHSPLSASDRGTEDDTLLPSMDFDKEMDKELTGKNPTNKDMSVNPVSLIDIDSSTGQGVTSPSLPKSSQSHFEFGVHSWLDKLGAQNKKFHEESLQTSKQQWDTLMEKQQEDSKKLDDFIQRSMMTTTTLTDKQGSASEEVGVLGVASVMTTTSKKVVKAQTPFSLQVDIETSGCGFQSIHVTEVNPYLYDYGTGKRKKKPFHRFIDTHDIFFDMNRETMSRSWRSWWMPSAVSTGWTRTRWLSLRRWRVRSSGKRR